ncbi:MAG: redoxin domain-containing protein [Bacteroidota bacterium]
MIRFWCTAILIFSSLLSARSQTDITIDVKHYESDSMIFGYYLADRMLVFDTLYRENKEPFKVKQDTSLDMGLYLLVSIPEGMFYQLIVDEDQEFEVTIDTLQQEHLSVTGSEENEVFLDYLNYVSEQRQLVQQLDQALATTDSTQLSIRDQLLKDKAAINTNVALRQKQIIEEYPDAIVSILMKANLPFEFPEFSGTPEEIQNQKYRYYKEHYFDDIDLNHRGIFRTPIIHQRINYYEESLTPKIADSIIQSVDYLLGLMDDDSEQFQYYLSYFLGKYGESKYIGMDAVYVHLALEYYAKGKAPWVEEDNLVEIVNNARRLKPVLIGKPAPAFRLMQQDSSYVSLSDLDNNYTILVFWKPGCGHCTKAMPHIIEFQEKYRDQGVEVVTMCTEGAKNPEECWKSIEEKNMLD